MWFLAVSFWFLSAGVPVPTPSAKVYYQLGLANADRIDLVAQASHALSANFRVFFHTFSAALES
jgi:hypothetical protein